MAVKRPPSFPHRIALIHEWFTPRSVGGSEQVVKAIDEFLFELGANPKLFALVDGDSIDPKSWLYGREVETSFIQDLPFGKSHVQNYLPLLPFAIEQIDLDSYPLVISSNHLVAKGVLTSPDQLHVSYIHTPVRYAWDQMNVYLRRSRLANIGLAPVIRWQLHCLRAWDQLSAGRVDHFIANSRFTARRIYKYWRRDSEVIHPPVRVNCFRPDQIRDEFYLCVCRLVPNKRVDLVVEAFNQLKLPLIIVGTGPEKRFLDQIAGPNVKLLGHQTTSELVRLMETCRAFVYAGMEDFGIAPVEAMAAGAPVIAYGQGGLLDTVRCASQGIDSPTGVLFPSQKVSSLVEAVTWFKTKKLWESIPPESLHSWASKFGTEAFYSRLQTSLFKAWENHDSSCAVASSDPLGITYLQD